MKRLLLWLSFSLLGCSPVIASAMKLPFLTDDYTKARAEAVQRKLPLFVEVWAPW
jgi:hypothetical protein